VVSGVKAETTCFNIPPYMMNPWKETGAFNAMFADEVMIKHDGVSNTVRACTFPPDRVDPFSEADAESSLLKLTMVIRARGCDAWNFDTPPQIGDYAMTVDGKQWKITDVVFFDDNYTIEARSVD